jgi:hypothetical protein
MASGSSEVLGLESAFDDSAWDTNIRPVLLQRFPNAIRL